MLSLLCTLSYNKKDTERKKENTKICRAFFRLVFVLNLKHLQRKYTSRFAFNATNKQMNVLLGQFFAHKQQFESGFHGFCIQRKRRSYSYNVMSAIVLCCERVVGCAHVMIQIFLHKNASQNILVAICQFHHHLFLGAAVFL